MHDYLAKVQDLHSRVRDLTAGDPELKISDKLFSIVLINSLPRTKYATVIQQLLSNVKNLTMAQVTARLRLEAASMASDEEHFKNVYAAKTVKPDNRKVGPKPNDLCNVHSNPKHTNLQCFSQKDKTKPSHPNSLTDEEMVKRYKALVSMSENKVSTTKVAANATAEDEGDKDSFITYSAFGASTHQNNLDHFLIDTGANTHVASDSSLLHDIHPIDPVNINGIAGSTGKVTTSFKGTTTISCRTISGQTRTVEIKDLLLVPHAGVNLLAVSKITKDGARFSGDNNHISLSNQSRDYVITGTGTDGLYKVRAFKATSHFAAPATIPTDVWHRRFGHLNHRSLSKVSPSSSKSTWCEACTLAKSHRLPFSSHLAISESPLYRIHSDVAGPMPVMSTGGGRYIVSFIDDATRFNYIRVMKSKSEVFSHFVNFLIEVERLHGSQIKVLKSDRGGEYMSKEFNQYLSQKGIKFERASPETPEQNPVSERFNQSLLERTRAIMIDTGLPQHLWGEIVVTVSFILNISPSSTLDMNTPYSLWHENMTGSHSNNTDFLRAIGCAAYPLLKTTQMNKLSPKSKRCILVGYELGARAYRLWDPETKKIIVSRNVVFNKKLFPCLNKDTPAPDPIEIDDILMHFSCEHSQHQQQPNKEVTSTTSNPFFYSVPDTVTFQRPRSLLTQQFPEFLPPPTSKFSDPPRDHRCSSPISVLSSSSPNSSPPSSPRMLSTVSQVQSVEMKRNFNL